MVASCFCDVEYMASQFIASKMVTLKQLLNHKLIALTIYVERLGWTIPSSYTKDT